MADHDVDAPVGSIPIIFGEGLGGITGIGAGLDGYLYVLTYLGDLYRILPLSESTKPKNPLPGTSLQGNISQQQQPLPTPANGVQATIAGIRGEMNHAVLTPLNIEVAKQLLGTMLFTIPYGRWDKGGDGGGLTM